MVKKIEKYYKKHPWHNATTHFLLGAGIGILATYPLVGTHPVRWGITLIALGLLGKLWAYSR